MFMIFQKILIRNGRSDELIDWVVLDFYFKNLTAHIALEISKEIWEIMQEKGLELENQDPGFQTSGEITEEDFENLSIPSHIPVFIFLSGL